MSRECQKCGDCCRYILLPIPDMSMDYIRFLDLHRMEYQREGNQLFMKIKMTCKYLAKDNLCSIYQTRPNICKNGWCSKL